MNLAATGTSSPHPSPPLAAEERVPAGREWRRRAPWSQRRRKRKERPSMNLEAADVSRL